MRFLLKLLLCFVVGVLMMPIFASARTMPEVKIFDVNGQLKQTVKILNDGYNGSVNFAVGDILAGDAKELVICQGAGTSTKIWIYDLAGDVLESFFPYGEGFNGGCSVALADNNGDLKDEIIVGAGAGGGPQVKVFKGSYEQRSFFAFDKKQRNGVKIASRDLGHDGRAEIIAFSNYNQVPEYDIFDNSGAKIAGYKLSDLNNNGVDLVVGDFNGDGLKETAYIGGYGNKLEIKIVGYKNKLLKTIPYANVDFRGSLNLAAGDINNDGQEELVVTEGYGGNGQVSIYNFDGVIVKSFKAFDNFSGALGVAINDIDNDGRPEIIILPEQLGADLQNSAYKFATVDLTTQTAFRYQDGKLLDTFLISSGKAPNLTPLGAYAVTRKRPSVHMTGPGYDLPGVPWVTSFFGAFTFHGTYWHHNFGHPMSHGCINMKTPEAKIIYDWSQVGMPVIIFQS